MTKRDIKLEFHLESCNEPFCETCEEAKPNPRSWPGDEGYCDKCNMLVAVDDGLLIEHKGSFASHYDNASCLGSNLVPLPLPDNVLDPWEGPDGNVPKRSGRNDPTGQSYGG